ncbi:hypothetical protein BC833DRAFT_575555 [Globomyces pollinis-pini]|nr:hypothetical protein BC833DRAFT_575555 [Globomyces pollinis-pini]
MDLKSQKYDRQLRLWGAHGQTQLEQSKICLIGANNLGTETLKNLILPAIGSYCIVDNKIITGSDVGSNFFLEKSTIGQNRAKITSNLLNELNDHVQSTFIEKDPHVIIHHESDFFKQFNLIIVTELAERDLLLLDGICQKWNIPLVIVRIYGFLGYFRIINSEHTIVESYPETKLDLRLDCPWDELIDYAYSFRLKELDTMGLSHVPFPALLLQTIKKWNENHDGLPRTREEKDQFSKILHTLIPIKLNDDENVREAQAHCFKLFSGTKIPLDIDNYLKDPSIEINSNSSDFWILMFALRKFVQNEGSHLLPLPGFVPDMKSDTTSFVQLQKIYHDKALVDKNHFKKHLYAAYEKIGRTCCDDETIDRFCKNAAFVKVIRGTSLNSEYQNSISDSTKGLLANGDENIKYYFLLRAVDRFYQLHGRYPGSDVETQSKDMLAFETLFDTFLKELSIDGTGFENHLKEILRAGGCEMPNMAAVMGGIASQEIIKLITHQYVPLDNAIIYDGIHATTTTLKL